MKKLFLIDFNDICHHESEKKELMITRTGLRTFLEELESAHGQLDFDNVLFAADWTNHEVEKMFFIQNSFSVFNISNPYEIAIGSLMIDGYKAFEKQKKDIEEVVIITSKPFFVPLLQHFIKHNKNVTLYGWSGTLNVYHEILEEDNPHFQILFTDGLFHCLDKGIQHGIEEGYFWVRS